MLQDTQSLNRRYETVAWGVFFIFFGITSLIRGLPSGISALGIGVILLGLNLARYVSRIPTSGFTMTLGVIAVVMGAVDLARSILNPALELPVFPVLLIVIGVIWLIRGTLRR